MCFYTAKQALLIFPLLSLLMFETLSCMKRKHDHFGQQPTTQIKFGQAANKFLNSESAQLTPSLEQCQKPQSEKKISNERLLVETSLLYFDSIICYLHRPHNILPYSTDGNQVSYNLYNYILLYKWGKVCIYFISPKTLL